MGANILQRIGNAHYYKFVKSLQSIEYSVASAQVKSCLMLAGLFAEGETRIKEML